MSPADASPESGDDEWEESAPGSWEWLAAIGGIVVVVALFAAWLTISARADDPTDVSAANAGLTVAGGSNEIDVAGTVQEPSMTTTTVETTTTTSTASTSVLSPEELVPLVSQLVVDGQQCGSAAAPTAVEVVQLTGQVDVALVRCDDQRSRVFEVDEVDGAPILTPLLVEVYDSSGRVVEETADLIGDISIDAIGSITLSSDFRAIGDCGVTNVTEWNGARFELQSASGRLDCEATEDFAALPWPVIFPPTERGPCVPGEATIGEGDVLATQVLDVDGDGQSDLLTLTQRGTAGFVRVATATGQVFQAGIGGSSFAADQVAGVRDLDGDAFTELFVGALQGELTVDMVLTRSQCGWIVAGDLGAVNRQVQQPDYRCAEVDGTVEILVSSSTVIPDTAPARFLHLTERYRLIDGALVVQRIDRLENDQALIDIAGASCT